MKLFEIDEVTKLPVPTAECRTIASINEIVRRIRKIDGDADGRKKTRNMQELAYIGLTGVYDSRFRLLGPEERDVKVRKLIGLPEDWKPDQLVLQGLEDYKETQLSETSELVDVLSNTIKSLTKFADNSQKQMAALGINAGAEVKVFLDTLNKIPETVDNLKKAKDQLSREQDALSRGKKGRNLNKFEL